MSEVGNDRRKIRIEKGNVATDNESIQKMKNEKKDIKEKFLSFQGKELMQG